MGDTSVAYDPEGRLLTTTVTADGTLMQRADTTYTPTGQKATTTDPKGNVTRYGYDAADRLVSVTDPVGRVTTLIYDRAGRQIRMVNPAIQSVPLVQRAFTPDGQVARLVVARDSSTFNVTTYGYDGLGRLSTTIYQGGSTEGLTYDPNGNVLTRTTRANQTLTYTYDTLNRLATKAGPSLPTVTYGYDLMDRLTGVSDTGAALVAALPPSGGTARFATTMTYDALNRPLGASFDPAVTPAAAPAQASVTFGHAYSAGDQRIGHSASDSTWLHYPPASAGTTAYTANGLDQYAAVGSTTPTYDGNGNLTFDGTYTYAYDAENRLLSASQGGTVVGSYDWDAQGRRKQKTAGGGKFVYVTDADNREVLAYNGASGQLQRWSAFGPGPNEVLAVMSLGGARTTPIPDIQGSLIASLDSGTGGLAKTNYLPFGQSATTAGVYRYTGQRIDAETGGLYYYRARMYAPRLGRFLQPDPIGTDGGTNLYAYLGNDPLNQTDPSGNIAPWILAAGVSAATGGAIDIGMQLIQNGGSVSSLNWASVGASSLAGAALSGVGPSGWLLGRGGERAAQFGYTQSPGLLNRGSTRFGWSYNAVTQTEVLSARIGRTHFDVPRTSIAGGANPVRDALVAGSVAGASIGGTGLTVANAGESQLGTLGTGFVDNTIGQPSGSFTEVSPGPRIPTK